MSRIRADRYTNRLGTGAPVFSNGVNITGNVGVGTTVPTSKLTVVGNMDVTGTVSVGGTLTYEDVTSIDSVGVITAKSGIHVTGGKIGIATDMTSQNVMLGVFGDGTGSKKPATIYQNSLTGTGSGNGFYVGLNHNDQTGYVWNYEAEALSFATNNVQRARIDSDGYMTVAPSGMVIRSGFYDTGYGSGARTVTTSATYSTANINGTGQVLHNLTKQSANVLAYTKVSSNSHLNISVSFPFYINAGAAGFGIRGMLSTNDGAQYYTMSELNEGPANGWGAGGYGGNTSGVFNYNWNTRMNTSQASTILAKTGTIRFYFDVKIWTNTDTLYFIDYNNSYAKKGTIIVQEIAE
jgi:hypothetical protein